MSVVEQIDAQLEQLFASWNIYSTLLVVLIIAIPCSSLLLAADPDLHPFLLLRQSYATPVRQPGESAVYRRAEVPHGYPLQSGLNVKDDGAPMYTSGRDGDLRDIWKKAVKGSANGQKLISVKGKDVVEKHSLEDLSRELNAVGRHLRDQGVSKVAVCLHNSMEMTLAIFAGAFYSFTVVLISPSRFEPESLSTVIQQSGADALIAPAGVFPPAAISNKQLKTIVWVVEPSSRHMDFGDFSSSHSNSYQWHDIADRPASTDMRPHTSPSEMPKVVTVNPPTSIISDSSSVSFTEYTQKSLAAATAAQLAALPRAHTIQPTDTLLSLESLADIYPLTLTLAALFAGASIALLSAAGGPNVDFDIAYATNEVSPTIVVAGSSTMARTLALKHKASGGILGKIRQGRFARALASGAMKVAASTAPGGIAPARLVYIPDTPGASNSVPLSAAELNELRFATGSRIVYALVVPGIAGSVAQTNMLDYREDSASKGKRSHFGPPVAAVEIKVVDTPERKVGDEDVAGELVVHGPAVVDGQVKTGLIANIGQDGTLVIL